MNMLVVMEIIKNYIVLNRDLIIMVLNISSCKYRLIIIIQLLIQINNYYIVENREY